MVELQNTDLQLSVNSKTACIKNKRILVLTRYASLGASSRLRFFQYFTWLYKEGLNIEVQPLFDDTALLGRYSKGYFAFRVAVKCLFRRLAVLWGCNRFDLIWIEKEALPWFPQWLELALLRGMPYVLDYDDAVFHNYDRHRLRFVRWLFSNRLDGLMSKAALVVGGNNYLVKRAKDAGAPWVEMLPTVIDLLRYPYPAKVKRPNDCLPRIVWIGSPSTVRYLQILRQPLEALALRVPFVLRVIGGNLEWPGVNIEYIPWEESTEVEAIAQCDVGVMPLEDSPWERGKCGYKLIQYMACGLPVVASPVGVNIEIVREDNSNGFTAVGSEAWEAALEILLTNAELRSHMGQEGRRLVESTYCLDATGFQLVELLKQACLRT